MSRSPTLSKPGTFLLCGSVGTAIIRTAATTSPRGLNLKFDRAVLVLKAAGFETDKSDVLSALISRFVNQVDMAEKAATIEKGMNLKSTISLTNGQDLEDRLSQIDSQFSEIESLSKKLVDQQG